MKKPRQPRRAGSGPSAPGPGGRRWRVPLLAALMVLAGALLARSCGRQAQRWRREYAGQVRAARLLEVLAEAARGRSQAGEPPAGLAVLAAPGAGGAPGPVAAAFRRGGYAELPEFRGCDAPAELEVRGEELAWGGHRFRLWPDPAGGGRFVIFAWPEAPGAGGPAWAVLSWDREHVYCTSAARCAGAGREPSPQDLGAPFDGRVNCVDPGEEPSPAEMARAWKETAGPDGRKWLRQKVTR